MKKEQEQSPDGKTITTTKHPDGRKDVHIEVNMLDVKESDPATQAAKEVIEKKIIPELANADVLVIVVHKPSNQIAHKMVKLPHVRAFAEAAVKAHIGVNHPEVDGIDPLIIAYRSEYVIVEHHITNGTVQTSTL